MPIDNSRLDAFGREVLDLKPIDVRVGARRMTDHERFMRIFETMKFQEYYNSLRGLEDDDDFDFMEDDDGAAAPVPQIFEDLEIDRQTRRKRSSRKAKAPDEPPLPLPDVQTPSKPPLGAEGTEGTGS